MGFFDWLEDTVGDIIDVIGENKGKIATAAAITVVTGGAGLLFAPAIGAGTVLGLTAAATATAATVSPWVAGGVALIGSAALIGQVLQETAQEELEKWEQACEDLDHEIRKQDRCVSNALKQSETQLDAKQCRIQLEAVRKTEGELALALESHQKVIQAMELAIHDATVRQNEIASQLSNLDESSEKRAMKEEFAALEALIQEQVRHRSELEEQAGHLSDRMTRLKARAKKLPKAET